MARASLKPSVVSSAILAPLRSIRAFVTSVVPWTIVPTCRASTPSRPSNSASPLSTPSDGSSGAVRTLPTARLPVSSSIRTISVNIPPMSTPTRWCLPAILALGDDRQSVRQLVETFDAVREDVDEVFDHDGARIGSVRWRLYGEHHPRLDRCPLVLRDVGRFFVEGVYTQRVAVMPAAEARVAVLRDVVLGRAEDLRDLYARSDPVAGPVVGLLEHAEEAVGGGLGLTIYEGAAAVPPVAAHGGAAVEFDEVALREAGVAFGVDAYAHPSPNRRQDPLVRVAFVAGVSGRGPRDAHHVALAHVRRAHAGLEVLDHRAHPRLGELRRQPEPLHLERVLYTPEGVHVVRKVLPFGVGG